MVSLYTRTIALLGAELQICHSEDPSLEADLDQYRKQLKSWNFSGWDRANISADSRASFSFTLQQISALICSNPCREF